MAKYALPELEFDYSALEPHISAKILELHHQKHHAAYVKNANATVEKIDEARQIGDFTKMAALERALAFNLSGHVLHSLYWRNLAPAKSAGARPSGELGKAIDQWFGGFEPFQHQMTEVASTVMGSGWAALTWEPLAGRLLTTQIYDHQSNLSQSSMPLLVLDAWEHAYYLQYQNRKEDYLKAIWNVVSWKDVARRFDAARAIDLQLGPAR